MQRGRSGFIFEMTLGLIAIIGIALIVLIFMFYRASTTEIEPAYSGPIVESEQEIKKRGLNSYLDNLENYQEQEVDSSSEETSRRRDRSNVIARGSELSESSIINAIDQTVEEALTRGEESATEEAEPEPEVEPEPEANTTQP